MLRLYACAMYIMTIVVVSQKKDADGEKAMRAVDDKLNRGLIWTMWTVISRLKTSQYSQSNLRYPGNCFRFST